MESKYKLKEIVGEDGYLAYASLGDEGDFLPKETSFNSYENIGWFDVVVDKTGKVAGHIGRKFKCMVTWYSDSCRRLGPSIRRERPSKRGLNPCRWDKKYVSSPREAALFNCYDGAMFNFDSDGSVAKPREIHREESLPRNIFIPVPLAEEVEGDFRIAYLDSRTNQVLDFAREDLSVEEGSFFKIEEQPQESNFSKFYDEATIFSGIYGMRKYAKPEIAKKMSRRDKRKSNPSHETTRREISRREDKREKLHLQARIISKPESVFLPPNQLPLALRYATEITQYFSAP